MAKAIAKKPKPAAKKAGTKKTAASAAKLTTLADGLKSSVAGFKVA